MKKTLPCLILVLICTAAGFGQEIEVRDLEPVTYAGLDCTGPYTQITAKIMEFMGTFFGQGLTPTGGVITIYYNQPGPGVTENDLKWTIGMPISPASTPAAPLVKGEFKYPKVVFSVHVGPYDKLHETYAKMTAYLEANGWKPAGPVMEIYLNNPQEVAPEQLQTEIYMPVEKK